MESNLSTPWDVTLSPPARPGIMFYAPGSDDMLFGAVAEIEIRCQVGIRSVGLRYALCRNHFTAPFLQGEAEAWPANTYVIKVPTARLYPGFYDLKVWLDTGEATPVETTCVFGYRVDAMKVRDTRPADFAAFWGRGKATLKTIPLDIRMGEWRTFKDREIDAYNLAEAALPGDYDPAGHKTDEVESCKVSFAGANGMRVHGWLAKPKGRGPFPAMLVLPGAGFAARPRPLEHARHGYLTLDIQIHGQEVDLREYPKIPGYYSDFTFEPADAFYYQRVYLNALQGLNVLALWPDVDSRRIVVAGGSQGGRLSVAVAALDDRVAAAVPAITHYGYVPYTQWSEACNQAGNNGMEAEIPPVPTRTPEQGCLPYYDVMNFAPEVKYPVLMNMGLIDPCSLATGVWAVYQRLGTKDKRMVALPGVGHDWSAEFDRRAWRWLEERLAP